MTPIRHHRTLGTAVVAGTLLLGALGAAVPSSAATPKLTAKPATGLAKGQKVTVSGSGFKSGDQVFLVECLGTATGEDQCNISTATPATITKQGKLPPTKFKLVTGKVGNGTCGTTKANVGNCVINAGNASGGDTATATIKFKVPKGK